MQDPTVTYGSYLAVDELLELQRPRSEGPEHDEMLFIVIHQVYELWFKQLLHEVDRVIVLLDARDAYRAQHSLKRILTILKVLVAQLDILETMTPLEFQSFRQRLEAASGFQSDQFRQLEFVLGNKTRIGDRALSRRQPRARGAATTLRRGDAMGCVSQVLVARGLRDSGGAAVARRQRAHRAVARIAVDADRSVSPRSEARRDVRAARRSRRRPSGVALSPRQDGAAHDRREGRHRRIQRRAISGDDLDDADISGPLGDPIAGCESGEPKIPKARFSTHWIWPAVCPGPVGNQAGFNRSFLCNSGTSIALMGVEKLLAPPKPIGEGGRSPTGAAI